jgi:hypothetical protein
MKRKVYLHIGTEKTGTASIQHFLSRHDDELREKGILDRKSLGRKSNMKLSAALQNYIKRDDLRITYGLGSVKEIDRFRKEILEDLRRELEEGDIEKIVVSSEHLSSRFNRPEEVERVREFFDGIADEFEVLVYLRRQDEFFESRYSTAMKTGGTMLFKVPEKGKESFDMHYLRLLELWSSSFGEESVTVRVYDRNELHGGDVVEDFIRTLSLPVERDEIDKERMNVSLGAKKIEFLKYLNHYLPRFTDEGLNITRGGIVKMLESVEIEDAPLRLGKKDRSRFMRRFEEENSEVAKRFLGRERLFEKRSPKKSEAKAQKLGVKETFMIFARLWEMQQQKMMELREKLEDFRRKQFESAEKIRSLRLENALLKGDYLMASRFFRAEFSDSSLPDAIREGSLLLRDGFYHPEKWGVWCNGEKSSILLLKVDSSLLQSQKGVGLLIEYRYLKGSETLSRMRVNGLQWRRLDEKAYVLSPDELERYNGLLVIEFSHENASSPHSLGLNEKDRRVMGCGIKAIGFEVL